MWSVLLVGMLSACGPVPGAGAGAQIAHPAQVLELQVQVADDLSEVQVTAVAAVQRDEAPVFYLSSAARDVVISRDDVPIDASSTPDETGPYTQAHQWTVPRNTDPHAITISYRLPLDTRADTIVQSWTSEQMVFLSAVGAWYPRGLEVPIVRIELDMPENTAVVGPGERTQTRVEGLRIHTTVRPHQDIDAIDLAIGRWDVEHQDHGEVVIGTFLQTRNEDLSRAYIESLQLGLEKFEGMLGRYPFPSFNVVEAPVGGVFAFAGFTLVAPEALVRQETIDTTIHHELLHAWFGYTVQLGPGGNWVEGLVTYLVEHEYTASRHRVEVAMMRKRLLREHRNRRQDLGDLPMRLISHSSQHASAEIGYAKGAMVFHMLRRQVGDAAFFEGLRNIVDAYAGQEVTWEDLLLQFEKAGDDRLAEFATLWLERTGGPALRLTGVRNLGPVGTATGLTAPHQLWIEIEQTGDPYRLQLPIAVKLHGDVVFQTQLEVPDWAHAELIIEVPAAPEVVRIDPEYDLFRILNDDEAETTLRDVTLRGGSIALPEDAPRDLVQGVELSLAMGLAANFQLANAADDPTIRVQPLSGLTPHEFSPVELRFEDGLLLRDESIPEGTSLVFAQPGAVGPEAWVLLADGHDATRLLMLLDQFAGWSYVLWQPDGVRVGLWRSADRSVARIVDALIPTSTSSSEETGGN